MKKTYIIFLTLILIRCASQPDSITPINQFPELNVGTDGTEHSYLCTTYQYQGNEIGEIKQITGYRVFYKEKDLQDGKIFYHFYQIEHAEPVTDINQIVWNDFDQISEFKVIIDENNEINSAQKYLDQIPHDGMETYNIYVSLMDIVMYHKYLQLARINLSNEESYEIPATTKQIADWNPIVKNIRIIETPTYLYDIGFNKRGNHVYYYKNDGTKLFQTIYVGILRIPSKGTTRFMGFIETSKDGMIFSATLSEYFSMEIWPLFFMKMNMLVRREQTLELIE